MRRRITWALMYRVKCMGEADLRRLYMYTNILDEIYSRSWWFAVTRSVCAFGVPIADSSPNDVGSGMDSYVEEMVGEFLEKK